MSLHPLPKVKWFYGHVDKTDSVLKKYLSNECKILIENIHLVEGIESALPYASEPERIDIIQTIISSISNLT